MLVRLVRLEILKLWRDRRLAAVLSIFGGVMLLSAVVAWVGVSHAARIKAAVTAEERQRWLGQGEKDPHSAAHYSIYAFKPSLPLEAIDPGVAPFVGEAVWLEAHVQNDLLARPEQDASAFERLGLVDPAGLLTRLGPLAIFLLAFAVAARERHEGALGLALGLSHMRTAYLGAKVLSVVALGSLVLVVPVALAGGASLATGATLGGVDGALRLAGWTLGAVAYIGVLSAVGVSVCLLARSVQIAFASLLLLWVVLVIGALPAANAAAEWLRPLPSFQRMKLVLIDEAPAYWSPEVGADQVKVILERYGVASEQDLDISLRGAQLDVAERHAQEVFDREIGGFYDRVMAQDAGYAWLSWLSPAVAFDVTSAAMAGTDFAHHRDFLDFAERYRRGLVNRMNSDLIPNPAVDGRLHTNDIGLWSQVPEFEYVLPSIEAATRSSAPAMAGLLAWLAASVALLVATARRVRP